MTKLILGLQKTDKGIIKIENKKNIKFGYTPQKTILLRRNVFDNIAFPMVMDGCNKKEIFEKVNLYLKKFDIDKFKKNFGTKTFRRACPIYFFCKVSYN